MSRRRCLWPATPPPAGDAKNARLFPRHTHRLDHPVCWDPRPDDLSDQPAAAAACLHPLAAFSSLSRWILIAAAASESPAFSYAV